MPGVAEAWTMLAIALPFAAYGAWSDLRTMTIPNMLSVLLLGAWLVAALVFLPLTLVGWHLLAAFIVLLVGFFANMAGVIGGGDVKFGAAATPFVAGIDVAAFLLLLSVSLIATLLLHRLARATPAIRRATPDWKSWTAGRNFPMGISIAAALVAYLALRVTVAV